MKPIVILMIILTVFAGGCMMHSKYSYYPSDEELSSLRSTGVAREKAKKSSLLKNETKKKREENERLRAYIKENERQIQSKLRAYFNKNSYMTEADIEEKIAGMTEAEIEEKMVRIERRAEKERIAERKKESDLKKAKEQFNLEKLNRLGMFDIGMTKEQVIDLLGYPNDKNRSVGSWGVHEQWVYEPYSKYSSYSHIDVKYLYFENGILTSYQE
jgi:hypothetical protein